MTGGHPGGARSGGADAAPDELPVVAALRRLSVFSADQAGAYREHFAEVAAALGEDARTLLATYVTRWAADSDPGVVVLTGNAGTGKTAVAEAYCRAVGGSLPSEDGMAEVADGRRVVKDLSGVPTQEGRAACLTAALEARSVSQTLICANEGVLRDALTGSPHPTAAGLLEDALRQGAATGDNLVIVNVNRQRPTSERLWTQLLDYVSREELWPGCRDCPFELGGCPMRTNAAHLRVPEVREQLRTLFRLGTGEAVPTLREVLAVLAWAIVGDQNCAQVKKDNRDRGASAYHAVHGYFSRVLGGGLNPASAERSPLLTGIRRAGLGQLSDLEVDGWLRDANGAPRRIRELAGDPDVTRPSDQPQPGAPLAGSGSPLDRIATAQGQMTFFALGEMVSTSEDLEKVSDGLNALVRGDGGANAAAEALWRQRVYFEAAEELGGEAEACRRLLDYGHIAELLGLAAATATGGDTVIALNGLVSGLNFLVTGFSSPTEGLIVPDPACLFARDPGSFRPALPSLVHSTIRPEQLSLRVPDRGMVRDVLDVDDVDVELVVDGQDDLVLRITPRMYEAIREAADFQGPVGQGVAEMNDLRGFYGRLAQHVDTEPGLRVADPDLERPSLRTINLPHFARRDAR